MKVLKEIDMHGNPNVQRNKNRLSKRNSKIRNKGNGSL